MRKSLAPTTPAPDEEFSLGDTHIARENSVGIFTLFARDVRRIEAVEKIG